MANIIKFEDVQDKIIVVRKQQVILDADVAKLYGVETKRVNEAVKNNPDKFPSDFLFQLKNQEVADMRSKFSTTNSPKSHYAPYAFTEMGVYMLATIIKSPIATQATIAIIRAFAKMRELGRTMQALATTEDVTKKKSLVKRSGEIMGELIGSELETTEVEDEIELNLAVVKIKHKVTRTSKK